VLSRYAWPLSACWICPWGGRVWVWARAWEGRAARGAEWRVEREWNGRRGEWDGSGMGGEEVWDFRTNRARR
jgi:hypothetical protein